MTDSESVSTAFSESFLSSTNATRRLDPISSLEDIEDTSAKIAYEKVFAPISTDVARIASRQERHKNNYSVSDFTYGEIAFGPFAVLMTKLYEHGLQETGGKFVDIGCGVGGPVIAAALMHDFEQCVGIEILESLHELCNEAQNNWRKLLKSDEYKHKSNLRITFLHGDAINIDWSDATVVFIHATSFTDELMQRLTNRAQLLEPGSLIIIITKTIDSNYFELMETSKVELGWGSSNAHIYRRIVRNILEEN